MRFTSHNEMIFLNAHSRTIIQQYHEQHSRYEELGKIVYENLRQALQTQGISVTTVEYRVKEEDSLSRKLELKGMKYQSLRDITDILGVRVITFYTVDVDKVAVLVKNMFHVDWSRSVDKRRLHELNSFGYNSLHYICQLKNAPPGLDMWFEIQMRTALQHVWSNINHDTEYKGEVQIPKEYIRQFGRLAGMLELIDDEFSRLRNDLTEYRRNIQSLVESGHLDEVPLTVENFRSYLQLKPFERLNRRIASINQAELYPVSLMIYLPILQWMGMKTLGDIEKLIADHANDAYQLALSQLAVTDLDIVSESVGIQNLCLVHLLKQKQKRQSIIQFFDMLNGTHSGNDELADKILQQANDLQFMNRQQNKA